MRLSEYVQRDLEFRILSGADLPEKLTVGAIGELYGVSATPVRLAIDALVQQELLVRLETGRLSISTQAGASPPAVAPQLPIDWEDVLAREIILMSLRGEDGFVREEAMAERHGIGRTMVRRVFARLAGGGLLKHVPRRGWLVPGFNHDEMDAYLAVRETLEIQALDLAREHIDARQIEAMLEGNSAGAVAAKSIDNRLHAYFIEQSGNRYIDSFFESHGRHYGALFDYAALSSKMLAEMAGQHVDILENVRSGRWPQAKRALANHIQSQKPVMEAMIQNLATPPSCSSPDQI